MDLVKHQDKINELYRNRELINIEIRKLQDEADKEIDRLFQEEFTNYSNWLEENPNTNPLAARLLYDIHKKAKGLT